MIKLPEWFELNKYKQKLSVEDFAVELGIRNNFFNSGRFKKEPARFLEEVINPISDARKTMAAELDAAKKASDNLEPLCILSVKQLCENFEKSRSHARESGIIDAYDILFENEFAIIPMLSYADKDLVNAFKKHIKTLRKNGLNPRRFAKGITSEIPEWQEFKLLALFDLLYWKAQAAPKLKYEIIGDAIWPDAAKDGIDIGQRIRKTGLPLIRKVFRHFVPYQLIQEANDR